MRPNNPVSLSTKHAALAIKPVQYTSPRQNKVVVESTAVAINLLGWLTPMAA